MSRDMRRRDMMRSVAAGASVATMLSISGCLGDDDGVSEDELVYSGPLILLEDTTDIVPVQLGFQQGTWAEYGLELEYNISTYPEWARALTSGPADMSAPNQAEFARSYNGGYEPVIFCPGEIQFNDIFVRPDSDIEGPADLEGRTIGLPGAESSTTLGFRSVILDEFGFDIIEDTDAVVSEPPAIYDLLLEEEIDACLQFTGQTVRGYANPDDLRPIFDLNEYWESRTGHSLEVTYWGGRSEFLETNPEAALNFAQAWSDSVDLVADDPQGAFDQFGLLSGLSSDDEVDVAVERFEEGRLLNGDLDSWGGAYLDAQYEFIELMAETGSIEDAPPREAMISTDELESLAEE